MSTPWWIELAKFGLVNEDLRAQYVAAGFRPRHTYGKDFRNDMFEMHYRRH